jgi:hypothetical protein
LTLRWTSPNLASAVKAQGQAMSLLLVFIISLVIGQSLSIGLGLMVERYSTPIPVW